LSKSVIEYPGVDRDDIRRLTYAELAAVRGISVLSAERLVRRRHWPRQLGNDGVVRVLVPGGQEHPAALIMKAEIKAVLSRLLDFTPRVTRPPDPRQKELPLFGVLVGAAPETADAQPRHQRHRDSGRVFPRSTGSPRA
jgi:hypothetical protein